MNKDSQIHDKPIRIDELTLKRFALIVKISQILDEVTCKPFATPFRPFPTCSAIMTSHSEPKCCHDKRYATQSKDAQTWLKQNDKTVILSQKGYPLPIKKARICKKTFDLWIWILAPWNLWLVVLTSYTLQFSLQFEEILQPDLNLVMAFFSDIF